MTFQSIHTNKRTGAKYAYTCECHRDPVTGKPITTKKYVGKIDPITGQVVPTNRKKPKSGFQVAETNIDIQADRNTQEKGNDKKPGVTGSATFSGSGTITKTRIAGPYMLLDSIAESTGLIRILKKVFKDTYLEILSLVYYIVHKGNALFRCESWSEKHLHPFDNKIQRQRISDLFNSMKEDMRLEFLSLWLKTFLGKEHLCYDITSISSYAESNEYIRKGYNRDGEKLPQVNLAVLFGQSSGLPAYYRWMPGNITDVKTIDLTMQSLAYLGPLKLNFILDRGFYSNANVSQMLKSSIKFILSVPSHRKWVENIIDKYYEKIKQLDNFYRLNDNDIVFSITELFK
jgi:hypothetical protein